MKSILEPEAIPDECFHTLSVNETSCGDFHVFAKNNETVVAVTVGSVGLGEEAVGFVSGSARFDAGGSMIRLNHVDFTDEYGYDEIQVSFENR